MLVFNIVNTKSQTKFNSKMYTNVYGTCVLLPT